MSFSVAHYAMKPVFSSSGPNSQQPGLSMGLDTPSAAAAPPVCLVYLPSGEAQLWAQQGLKGQSVDKEKGPCTGGARATLHPERR